MWTRTFRKNRGGHTIPVLVILLILVGCFSWYESSTDGLHAPILETHTFTIEIADTLTPNISPTIVPTEIIIERTATPLPIAGSLAVRYDPNLKDGDGKDYPIFLVPIIGDASKVLVDADEKPSNPDWSWDGELLAFKSSVIFPPLQCILNTETNANFCLESIAVFEWSPSSDDFVYVTASKNIVSPNDDECGSSIYRFSFGELMSEDRNDELVYQASDCIRWLSWAPSGEYMLIAIPSQEDAYRLGLYLYEFSTQQVTYLRNGVLNASWSPDSNYLALSLYLDDLTNTQEIILLDIHNGETKTLTNTKHHALDPIWSPDGSMLAYRVLDYLGATAEIMILHFDDNAVDRVSIKEQSCWPEDWLPGSQYLLFGCFTDGSASLSLFSIKTHEVIPVIPNGVDKWSISIKH